MEPLPFIPFTRPLIYAETMGAVLEVLRSGKMGSGLGACHFEARLSRHCGGRPVRVVSSATAALELALRLVNLSEGDEVITTPLAWVATSNVILAARARPVFVEIDPATRNLDLDRVEAAITPRTRVLLPVHHAGRPVDLERLHEMATRHGLRVIEDASHALGSTWRGKPIGAQGDLVVFSFQDPQNVTCEKGGALVLNTKSEALLVEKLRGHGVRPMGYGGMEVEVLGGEFTLSEVHAVMGVGQFAQLDELTRGRRERARDYFAAARSLGLESLGLQLPLEDFTDCNWHLFQVVLPLERLALERADLMAALSQAGIGSEVHYPAIHLFKLYRELGFAPGMFPHAEHLGRSLLSLPLFPDMTRAQVSRVVETLHSVCAPDKV